MQVKRALIAVPIAFSLALGISAAPSVISAMPAHPASSVGTTDGATTEQAGAAARAIIAAIKKLGPSAVKALKAALASYESFLKWWNDLPWYIRALGSGINLYTLYDAIKSLF